MRIEASRVGGRASLVRRCVLVAWIALCVGLPSATALAKPTRCRVIAVKLFELAGGGSEVMVRTDRAPNYIARVAQQGKRLVVDLRDAAIAGAEPAITDFRGVVGGVMTQSFNSQGAQTTRILIQLLKPAAYRISSSPQGLRIILSPSERTQAAPATSEPRTAAPADKPQLGRVNVRNIRFERQSDGDHVIVEVEGAPRYSHFSPSDTRGVLELADAALPTALQRTLDVSAFGGRVRAISIYRREGATMIDVDHAAGVSGTVLQHANTVHYVFSEQPLSSMQTGVAPDGQVARQIQKLSSPDAKIFEEAAQEWSSDPDVARAFLPGTTPMQQQQRFTGRRIDLDLKEADIHDVFRTLAKVGRVNIVAADDVSGNVTITMRNVPWDQALDTILQAKKLGMVRRGNIIRVANMADLNKERELALERRKAELQLAPIETRLVPVSYAQAQDMQKRAADLLSPRGTIAVDERTNVLIIRDVAGNLNQIEELIRALDTQTPQVLIEARIVEATSRFQRDVGIQWGGDLVFGPGTGNETGLVFPSSIGVVGGASDQNTPTAGLSPIAPSIPNPNFAVNLPATVGTGAGGALGLTFGSIDNTVNLNVRISAAEATGMLRIVSSPRILTLDNAEARITQGTLIPFSQISAQGVQTVFQEAKLQLLVTPHVTADGSVSMHVKINRDEPDFNQTSARGDPTILKREAETELLVRDGHTAVIGGIYTRNTGRNLDQVPLLGDIPVLGVLFQRRRSSDTRSELVIFLTPRIVNRAEALGQ